jgi:hypothetical protein
MVPVEILLTAEDANPMSDESSDHAKDKPLEIKRYFVDESGDPTLFGRRGKIIVGEEGCSTHFILGVLM